jgi:hypothetical protein
VGVVGIADVDHERGHAEQNDDDEDESENEYLALLARALVIARTRGWYSCHVGTS